LEDTIKKDNFKLACSKMHEVLSLYKLLPPRRPTFPQDMTEAEGELMQEHFNYWKTLVAKRIAVTFGPVADPRGIYGLAIIETEEESIAQDIRANDPASKHDASFRSEIHLMPEVILR
jgi:uncharacterized protein